MARWMLGAVAGTALVGLVVVALVLTGDSPDRPPPPDRTAPDRSAPDRSLLVIAHRGASAYAPHDTVAAAREALERGADVLEADVRQTRDGRLVALFNATLAPTTDVEQVFPRRAPWKVEDFTLAEVRRLDAGSWFGPRFAGERIPTLTELARTVKGSGVRLIIDAKSPQRYPGVTGRVARVVRGSPGLYLEVESFDWGFLRRLAGLGLPADIGLTGTPPPEGLDRASSYADAVNPSLSTVDAAYVARAHRAGLDVKVWSVNERAGMRRAIRMGVDGIYSHRPDLLRDVLGR
ncbi:MAG: glycerophosphodiester phosphodiesterase [Nocardioidaceae bacterium]